MDLERMLSEEQRRKLRELGRDEPKPAPRKATSAKPRRKAITVHASKMERRDEGRGRGWRRASGKLK